MRRKLPDDKKKKTISFCIDPKLYEILEKYCEENDINNYSAFMEKIIKEKLNNEEESERLR
jgi:metal-responsive CopG/Arc/MetJ family transcriptional regulator